jgi:hypothetical protein
VHLEPAGSCIRGDEARETLELSVVHEVLRFELSCLRNRVVPVGKRVAHSVADRDEGMGGCGDLESADRGYV